MNDIKLIPTFNTIKKYIAYILIAGLCLDLIILYVLANVITGEDVKIIFWIIPIILLACWKIMVIEQIDKVYNPRNLKDMI